MTTGASRRSRAVVITSVALLAAALLIVGAVDAVLLRSGEPLCLGRRCLMVTKEGAYVNAEIHGPIAYGSGTLVTYTAATFARSDLDTDGDGRVECREECEAPTHRSAPCVSRRAGNSWVYQPRGVFSCDGIGGQNFWPDAGF